MIAEAYFLNWSNPQELLQNQAVLTEEQNNLLNTYFYKTQEDGKPYKKYDSFNYYKTNAPIYIMSGWPKAKAMVFCGEWVPARNAYCPCQQRRTCQFCARSKVKKKKAQIAPAWSVANNFYFLTVSFKQNLFINEATSQDDITVYWKATKRYINLLKQKNVIDGAFNVDELAVQNILEKVVLPHTHSLVISSRDDLCIKTRTWEGDTKYIPNPELFPADDHIVCHLEPVLDFNSFNQHINYMIKAIDFSERYNIEHNEESVFDLNIATSFLINKLATSLKGVLQVHATGLLHPLHKSCIV